MSPSDVKKARKELGMSQGQMAKALGLRRSQTISDYELGIRTPSAYFALAVAHLLSTKSTGLGLIREAAAPQCEHCGQLHALTVTLCSGGAAGELWLCPGAYDEHVRECSECGLLINPSVT